MVYNKNKTIMGTYSNIYSIIKSGNFDNFDEIKLDKVEEYTEFLNVMLPMHRNIIDDLLELDTESPTYFDDINRYSDKLNDLDFTEPLNIFKINLFIIKNKMTLKIEVNEHIDGRLYVVENWQSDKGIKFMKGYELKYSRFTFLPKSIKKQIIDELIKNKYPLSDIYIDVLDDIDTKIDIYKRKLDISVEVEDFEMAIVYRNKLNDLINYKNNINE